MMTCFVYSTINQEIKRLVEKNTIDAYNRMPLWWKYEKDGKNIEFAFYQSRKLRELADERIRRDETHCSYIGFIVPDPRKVTPVTAISMYLSMYIHHTEYLRVYLERCDIYTAAIFVGNLSIEENEKVSTYLEALARYLLMDDTLRTENTELHESCSLFDDFAETCYRENLCKV